MSYCIKVVMVKYAGSDMATCTPVAVQCLCTYAVESPLESVTCYVLVCSQKRRLVPVHEARAASLPVLVPERLAVPSLRQSATHLRHRPVRLRQPASTCSRGAANLWRLRVNARRPRSARLVVS